MPNEAEVRHFILATAGHVDHGKTALVQALTGTDTDRLPEEKSRRITIELGFAHLDLPGFSIGVIDVPGHEEFVRNMIAGVGAIDLALLVVAADDGWMPQTEEHLQILSYLGVRRGVVALTKSDLGNVETRMDEIRRQLQNSPFAYAPIVATSVHGNGRITDLKNALTKEFEQLPPPREFGRPRLFVDRVFTVHGSGTVVTGSLSGGSFGRGDTVLIQPQNLPARIRALQSHNQPLEVATPRRRVALNLTDLAPTQIARGSTICAAQGNTGVSRVLDVLLTRSSRLDSNARPIRNGAMINLHLGSARTTARVQLQDGKEFPGKAILQPSRLATAAPRTIARLRLPEPVCAFVGDRFILRDASERLTIAGGIVLDAAPGPVKFRSSKQRKLLEERAVAPDDLQTLVRTRVDRDRFAVGLDLLPNAPFSAAEINAGVESLGASGFLVSDEKIVAQTAWWNSVQADAARLIDAEHAAHPERPGLEISRLRDALQLADAELFAALVRALAGVGYRQIGSALCQFRFRPSLPPRLQVAGERIREALQARPLDPPARREVAPDSAAIEALRFLCESGEVILVGDNLAMSADGMARMKAAIRQHLRDGKRATVSELRQATNTTRRVIVPLLEYFDRIGLTRRIGDRRMLR